MSDISLLNKTKFKVNDNITVHIPTLGEIKGDSPKPVSYTHLTLPTNSRV